MIKGKHQKVKSQDEIIYAFDSPAAVQGLSEVVIDLAIIS